MKPSPVTNHNYKLASLVIFVFTMLVDSLSAQNVALNACMLWFYLIRVTSTWSSMSAVVSRFQYCYIYTNFIEDLNIIVEEYISVLSVDL